MYAHVLDAVDVLLPYALTVELEEGLPAEVLMAHACLETGWLKHIPEEDGVSSKNLFGIKGDGISEYTKEYLQGKNVTVIAEFAVYPTYMDSIRAYVSLLKRKYPEVWDARKNPEEFFKRLEASAYNTDPDFAEKALKVHAMICEVLGYGG